MIKKSIAGCPLRVGFFVRLVVITDDYCIIPGSFSMDLRSRNER